MAESDDEARQVAHFQVVEQNGCFHWELINPHGTPQARSMADYDTEGEAAAAAEDARRLISGAPIRHS